mgnify:CR=1 FL=1
MDGFDANIPRYNKFHIHGQNIGEFPQFIRLAHEI